MAFITGNAETYKKHRENRYLSHQNERLQSPRLSDFVHHQSADYIFSGPFGIIGLILSQFENMVPLKPVLGGVGQCSTITLLHMNRLNKTESAIFVSLVCFLLPEDLHSELILSSLQFLLCRVAAVNVSPYIIIVQIIYLLVLWDRVPLKPMLGAWAELHLYINAHEQTQ